MEIPKDPEELEKLKTYHANMAQIHVIKYQLLSGLIENALGYDDTAPIFRMMIDKVLTCPDIDWAEKRREFEAAQIKKKED